METRNVELVYRQAILGAGLGSFDGIGFEFATGGGIVGIDLDHCLSDSGYYTQTAAEIVALMHSYTEYSPSGTDLHIFVQGDIPSSVRKKTLNKDTREAVEMYKEKRYFTVTAKPFHPAPIVERSAELTALYTKLFPPQQPHTPPFPAVDAPEYLRIGLDKDRIFRALWDGHRNTGDESSNDLALMNKLAHWCNRDESRMIEAFLASPHTAGKDDEHRDKLEREDYLVRTAQKAIADCRETAAERDAAYKLERARRDFSEASQLPGFAFINPIELPSCGGTHWTIWEAPACLLIPFVVSCSIYRNTVMVHIRQRTMDTGQGRAKGAQPG